MSSSSAAAGSSSSSSSAGTAISAANLCSKFAALSPNADEENFEVSCRGTVVATSKTILLSIPYFQALGYEEKGITFERNAHGQLVLDANADEFRSVLRFIANKSRPQHLFRTLPWDSDACSLLTLVDFLCIHVDLPSSMEELNKKIKDVADDYDKYGRSYTADRPSARDAAVWLAMSIQKDVFHVHKSLGPRRDHRAMAKLYNLIQFIVGHSRTFHDRLRRHFWNVAKTNLTFTPGQLSQISRWTSKLEASKSVSEDSTDYSTPESDDSDGPHMMVDTVDIAVTSRNCKKNA